MRPSRDNRLGPHLEKEKGRGFQGEKGISQGAEAFSDFAQQHSEGPRRATVG